MRMKFEGEYWEGRKRKEKRRGREGEGEVGVGNGGGREREKGAKIGESGKDERGWSGQR